MNKFLFFFPLMILLLGCSENEIGEPLYDQVRELPFRFAGQKIDLENFGKLHNAVIREGESNWRIIDPGDYCASVEHIFSNVALGINVLKDQYLPHISTVSTGSCEETKRLIAPQDVTDLRNRIDEISTELESRKVLRYEDRIIINKLVEKLATSGYITREEVDEMYSAWNENNKDDLGSLITGVVLSIGINSMEYWDGKLQYRSLGSIAIADLAGAYFAAIIDVIWDWGCGCWEDPEQGAKIQEDMIKGAIETVHLSVSSGFSARTG